MKSIKLILLSLLINFSVSAQDGIYLFGQMNNFPGVEMDVDVTIYTNPSVTTTLSVQTNGNILATWVDLPSEEWNYLEFSFVDCDDSLSTGILYEDSTNGLIDVFLEMDYCEGGDIYGCTLFNADNYNPAATIDNGSCYFSDCETIFQTFTETCGLVQFIAFPPNYSYTWTLNGEPYDATDGWIYFYPDEPGTYEFCAQRNNLGCEDAVYCTTFVIEECETECTEIAMEVEYNIGDNGCAIYVTADGDQAESDVWDMGDGSELIYYGGEMGIYHEYAANGEYEVCGTFYYENCVTQSCQTVFIENCGDDPMLGCTDPEAINYNPAATVDDGSCEYDFECSISFTVSPDTTGAQTIWITPSLNIIEAAEVEWDFGDGTTSSALYPSHTYSGDGPYTLCLTAYFDNPDGGYCEITHCAELSDEMINPPGMQQDGFSVNVVNPETTSVHDLDRTFGHLSLLPNPTTGQTQLNYNLKSNMDVTVEAFEITGKIGQTETISGTSGNNFHTMDVTNSSRGMYLIRLSANDQQIITRMVKQ